MTGPVDDPAIYYALSDLLVLPTHREGFGNVNIEAAAMEIPVVSTSIPGCIDSVEGGVTGMLVPPGDPETLGRAISRYLEDPRLRRRHGEAGRQRVERDFRQEVIWEEIYQEYCQLLQARGMQYPSDAV